MSDNRPADEAAPPRPDVPRYAPEPRFPPVLIVAWIVFGCWAIYYIAERLVPAYRLWARGL